MNASAYIGYGIMGTSDGFAAQTAGLIANKDIGQILDLDNRKIFAPFGAEIIAAIREKVDEHLYTYFVLYRYAVEQERSRKGAFYGSVVALKDCTADGFAIYNMLLELATNVKVYLDPETRRFLAPLEEIAFLQPDSLDEVIRSVKKHQNPAIRTSGFFAPLSSHSRNNFRFIDQFQQDPDGVERAYASSDEAVIDLVKNKKGIPIKPIILDDSTVEKKLEQLENFEAEKKAKEKEIGLLTRQLESLKEKENSLLEKQEQLNHTVHQLEIQLKSDQEQLEEVERLRSEKKELEADIEKMLASKNKLEQNIQQLNVQAEMLQDQIQQKKKIQKKREATPEPSNSRKQPAGEANRIKDNSILSFIRHLMASWHPLTRLAVLVLAFMGLGTIGYLTTTAFGKNKVDPPKQEKKRAPNDDLSRLEQEIMQYQTFDKQTQESYLARLRPFLDDTDPGIKKRAENAQMHILSLGFDYYQTALKKTDSIPVIHSQLIEEFEILKRQYDSVYSALKDKSRQK